VLPDYLGFSDPDRIQPYFVAEAEGHVMLDAVRAARRLLASISTDTSASTGAFVAGYSQGGHAAFAAADIDEDYAPDVKLAGVISYGGTTGLRALFLDFTVSAPLVIYVYSKQYGEDRFDPSKILLPRWAATLERDVTTQCIGGIQSYYPWVADQLFNPPFLAALNAGYLSTAYPEIERIMIENSTGLSGHGIPALIAQGEHDPVIKYTHQDDFVVRLRQQGSNVLYLKYPDLRHDTRQASFRRVRQWMRERSAEMEAGLNFTS
jgi:acetyl esterase/lipase